MVLRVECTGTMILNNIFYLTLNKNIIKFFLQHSKKCCNNNIINKNIFVIIFPVDYVFFSLFSYSQFKSPNVVNFSEIRNGKFWNHYYWLISQQRTVVRNVSITFSFVYQITNIYFIKQPRYQKWTHLDHRE